MAISTMPKWYSLFVTFIMNKIIGIDLGTTNSCVAVMDGENPKIILNSEGERTTPSVVAFTKDNERLVGNSAKRQAVMNPENTIFSIKRFMGRKYSEISGEKDLVPYKVVEGPNKDAYIEVNEKKYSPPEISAMIISKLKADAESHLGETVNEAVITVPAYFNDSQRQATKDAGKIAGLEVKRIINEPTAASLSYNIDENNDEKIAVYDFGGGTFDISILELGDGVFEVKSTSGDSHLGGDNIDDAVINWLDEEFQKENGISLKGDATVMQRLKEAAEKAKCELSSSQSTDVNIPFITAVDGVPKHLTQTLSRSKLEQICDSIIDRTVDPCKKCLSESKVEEVDHVVLVGGSTRIPKVLETCKNIFNKEPHKGVNPDEVVACGAAIQAGVLSGDVNNVLLLDVNPLSLGIETLGGVMTKLIEKNTTIPTRKTEVFSTASDNQPSVDIAVLQGEREMASHNKRIGNFKLDGIPPAPRGVPQIEVSFDIDANGILSVSAKDLGTGKEQKITITASSGLSEEEIEKMVKDAEENAENDKKQKELIEVKNKAENTVYQTEKQLEEHKDKLKNELKNGIEEKLNILKQNMQSEDKDKIEESISDVMQKLQEIGQNVYNDQSNYKENDEKYQNSNSNGKDNTVDAEYEINDE